jgi:mRNA interferase RelE/StbE
MSYELAFHREALKEWKKLDAPVRTAFKAALTRRLAQPRVPSAKLHGSDMRDVYKIKLRDAGYRLVYEVKDNILTVLVLAVGKRDKNQAYDLASKRKAQS